jgi:hypothetical protein
MSQQTINTGNSANDRSGDSLRSAFTKINSNFTELYTALGLNADTDLNLGAFEFTGSTISTTDSSGITVAQATTITSDLTVGGDITLDGVVKHSTIEKTGGAGSETSTALDLAKSVQVLVSADGNDDSWSLADGVEGQIMYFVPKGAGLNNHYINIANVRYFSEGGYTVGPKSWIPFQIDDNLRAEDWRSLAVAVFTDGAWNTDTSWFD